MTQRTLISLHSNEYIEGLRYYPSAVNLNTPNDLSNRIWVPKKQKI